MKGTKSKFKFGKLLYNDRFIMFFSVILAFGIWLNVSLTSQETRSLTVTDIPVTMPELSNDLKFFGIEGQTGEVRISGNSLVVASVTSSDMYITASDTSAITEPGTYTVNLVPKKGSLKNDYNFDSTVRPSSIEVYVDRYAEKEINITDKIDVSSVGESNYAATTTLAKQTVTVKGAESIINSIAEADAEYRFTDPLTETQTVEADIVLRDSKGDEVPLDNITLDTTTVSATVPILTIKTVSIVPDIVNAPDSFVYDSSCISVEPSSIQIAVPKDVTDDISFISTAAIDISKINSINNKVNVDLDIPSGIRNLNQITSVDVTFDSSQLTTKKVRLKSFNVINESENRKTTVSTKSIDISIVGLKSQLSSLTAGNITAVVDMSSKVSFSGYGSVPLKININSKFPFCWAYGSYEVDVNVEDTTNKNTNNGS